MGVRKDWGGRELIRALGWGCSGELLLDQQRFEDAAEKFDAAIEIEKDK